MCTPNSTSRWMYFYPVKSSSKDGCTHSKLTQLHLIDEQSGSPTSRVLHRLGYGLAVPGMEYSTRALQFNLSTHRYPLTHHN